METVASRLKEVMRERKLRQVDVLNLAKPVAKDANVCQSFQQESAEVPGSYWARKHQPSRYQEGFW